MGMIKTIGANILVVTKASIYCSPANTTIISLDIITIPKKAGTVINLTLNIALIPILAENGASIATVAAELSVMLVCTYHVKRELNTQNVRQKYLRAIITSLCILLIGIGFKYWMANVFVRLFSTIMIGMLCYGILNFKVIKDFICAE